MKKYLAITLGMVLMSFVLLLTPFFQSYLGAYFSKKLLDTRDADISVGRVFVNPLGKAAFQDVFVRDHQQDTLLYIKEARFNAVRLGSFLEGSPNLGVVQLDGLMLNIQKYKGDTLSNIAVFGAKLNNNKQKKTGIQARSVRLSQSQIRISNQNKPQRKPLLFDSLHVRLNDLSLIGDHLTLELDKMTFLESTNQFSVSQLSTVFRYSPTQMSLINLDVTTPNSNFAADVVLDYPKLGMRNFSELVQIQSDVKPSHIGVKDLKNILPNLGYGVFQLKTADLSGTLENFRVENMQLGFEDTSFTGDLHLNTSENGESQWGINIVDFQPIFSQWSPLFPSLESDLLNRLQNLGNQYVTGRVELGSKSSDVKLTLAGHSGSAELDLLLSPNDNDWLYSGFVYADDFNLGKLLDQVSLGTTSFALEIDGKGLGFDALNTEVNGNLDSFTVNGYDYQNIEVKGVFNKGVFDGDLWINDPNINMNFKGSFDTLGDTKNISCFAQVNHANLTTIGLSFLHPSTIFSGNIELVSQGSTADDFIGDLFVESGKLTNDNESFSFSRFTVQSRLNDGVRFVNLRSEDILDGLMYGKFSFPQIPTIFKNALGSYFSNYAPQAVSDNQFVNFNFNVRGKIASALIPGLELNNNTFVQGQLDGNRNSILLQIEAPELIWRQTEIQSFSLNIDNTKPSTDSYISFEKLQSKWLQASKFNLTNTSINDTLFFKANYHDTKKENLKNQLNFYLTFDQKQQPVVGIQPSSISYLDQFWNINTSSQSRLVFNNMGYALEPIVFSNESSNLQFSVEKRNYQLINAHFENVKLLDILPPNPKFAVGGVANGSFNIRNDAAGIGGTSKVQIDDFSINDVGLGNASLELTSTIAEQYGLSFVTQANDLVTSHITGNVLYPSTEEASLQLHADFTTFPAAALKNLMGKAFDNVSGGLNGSVDITGKLDTPKLEGDLFLNQFSFDVPYLGVSYDFPQDLAVAVSPDLFEFKSGIVRDTLYDSKGVVEGKLTHNNFKNFIPDFRISSERILVLDTKFNPQSSYYGTAFMNGLVHIFGDSQNINFDIQGQTATDTNISIPILEATALNDATYIRFVDKHRNMDASNQLTKPLKGLSLNFDLDVNPDARLGIVVDTETGSTLSGKGVGNILMEINSDGVFNIWGDYIALEGAYNFKNLGIIEKNFSVQPGGTIVWDGDPYSAQINMQAIYEVPGGANPTVLIETTGVNRKIPTEVTVNLNGNLLNLETPTFDIDFPNASSNLRNELEYRLVDEERRQLQAISLLSQGVFISQFSLSALSTQTLTNNLFQKASGVFESIFSGDEDKMNIGLDYLQGDRNAAATVQTRDRLGLTLVTQISDRMLINGKVGVPVGGVEETIIVGDVTIEFLLNKDGSLRARIFNRENEFQYFGDDLGYTQGVGLSYKVEFNDFKSLINKIIKKNAVL